MAVIIYEIKKTTAISTLKKYGISLCFEHAMVIFLKDSGVPCKYHDTKYNVPSDTITLPCLCAQCLQSTFWKDFLGFFLHLLT